MRKYLEDFQQIPNQIFKNFSKSNSFPHAILLSGTNEIPLLDISIFLAKTIICENKKKFLACDNCSLCKRIENGTYPDLIIIDGKDKNIKKENFEYLQKRFSVSGVETNNRIYIINCIENSTNEGLNSLLKFIEEPDQGVYAILTTENISSILPTIISRCQNIHFKNHNKDILISKCVADEIPIEDALILSYFIPTIEKIKEQYQDPIYISLKRFCLELINKIISKEDIFYFAQIEIADLIKTRAQFNLLIQILEILFFDIINIENKVDVYFKENKDLLVLANKLIKNKKDKLNKIMFYKDKNDYNVSIKLLIDNLFIDLKEE